MPSSIDGRPYRQAALAKRENLYGLGTAAGRQRRPSLTPQYLADFMVECGVREVAELSKGSIFGRCSAKLAPANFQRVVGGMV